MMRSSSSLNTDNKDIVIEPGLVLRAGPTVFRIDEIRGKFAILQNAISLTDKKQIPLAKLLAQIGEGKVVAADEPDVLRALNNDPYAEDEQAIPIKASLIELSEPQKVHVLRLWRYIRSLRALGYECLSPKNPTIQLDLDRLQREIDDKVHPKAAWVYKWSLKLDDAGGDPRALIPQFNKRGGAGKQRQQKEIQSAYKTVLDRLEDDETAKIKTFDVVSDVKAVLVTTHPEQPELALEVNWSTAERKIQDRFSEYERCKRNHGEQFANKKYREWYPRENAQYPLLVWETDDTDSSVFTIDERSGLPSGRCYITPCIDQHSQAIPGLEISEKPRSTWSAISAVVNSILPTNIALPEFAECKSEVEFYGKPGIIVFDNALYNHASEIELIASDLGVIPAWAKPFTPTEKSYQEGWNGRVKAEFLPSLSGFRGDPTLRDGLKVGMATANMGLLAFKIALMKWIYDEYSNQPIDGGMSARQKWHLGMRYTKPRVPRDIWGYKLAACLHKTLKLRPEGILFCGLIYTSPAIRNLRQRYGHNTEALFRFNPGNLGEIYVQEPTTKAYSSVPCTNPEYANGLTLYQHKLIRKLCRENKIRNPVIPQLLRYREELRVLTEQLRFSKRLRERKRSMRTGEIPIGSNQEPKTTQSTSIVFAVTELENQISEIDEVEMDLDEDGWNLPDVN